MSLFRRRRRKPSRWFTKGRGRYARHIPVFEKKKISKWNLGPLKKFVKDVEKRASQELDRLRPKLSDLELMELAEQGDEEAALELENRGYVYAEVEPEEEVLPAVIEEEEGGD